MKIKRFFAPDIRKAMRMVKDELGADAVIMSNRSVDDGVEIVAARDFDEQELHRSMKNQQADKAADQQQQDTDAEKPLHVVSSARKRGAEGAISQPRPRREIDQYVGYAEKVHMASGPQKSAQLAEKLKQKETAETALQKNMQVNMQSLAAIEPKKTLSKPSQMEQLMQELKDEMRKEIKELKGGLDQKLALLAFQQGQENQVTRLELIRVMGDMGFSKSLALKVANRLGAHHDFELAYAKMLEMLIDLMPIAEDTLLEHGGIAALVGPTGVGKTTTIAKIAAQFILKHGARQVALITTDNYRIGAHEQLNTYGRILDIPVRVANNGEELRAHINSFMDRRLILIDTAGMSQRDMRLADQINTLAHEDIPIKTYLVMSAATQYKAMTEIMAAFEIFQPQAGILTKLDETVTQGTTLSAIIEQQLPLAFLTDGQQVPEDIQSADAVWLMDQCESGLEQSAEQTHEMGYDQWVAEGYA